MSYRQFKQTYSGRRYPDHKMVDATDVYKEPESARKAYVSLSEARRNVEPPCAGQLDQYVPNRLPSDAEAEKMCRGCPLLELCREYGEAGENYGVWGGKVFGWDE